ncbi:hypothetical protein [Streptomyces venezuelae]|uniref:hypothetical protein n=1 Tax=Streptomyces venezuelae TaxID=54571 RepID=UPI003667F8FE
MKRRQGKSPELVRTSRMAVERSERLISESRELIAATLRRIRECQRLLGEAHPPGW